MAKGRVWQSTIDAIETARAALREERDYLSFVAAENEVHLVLSEQCIEANVELIKQALSALDQVLTLHTDLARS